MLSHTVFLQTQHKVQSTGTLMTLTQEQKIVFEPDYSDILNAGRNG